MEGSGQQFEAAFEEASAIISSMPGYLSHELQRSVYSPDRYVRLVRWETLEAHTGGFRGSEEYREWKRLLHGFYGPLPNVEHFEAVHEEGRGDEPTRAE